MALGAPFRNPPPPAVCWGSKPPTPPPPKYNVHGPCPPNTAGDDLTSKHMANASPSPHIPSGRSLTKKKKRFLCTGFPKRPRVAHMFNHGWWRLVAVGGGWRLAVGGWWQLAVGSWQLAVGGGWWWLAVGGWRLVAVGGGWWLVVGGPLGRSLTKKKISVPKDRPVFPATNKLPTSIPHHN